MELDFSEEQQMLAELSRGVCAEYCPLDVVRSAEEDSQGYALTLWEKLGSLGLVGLGLPEQLGGGGQGLLECAILYEEFGRTLAPTPHFVSAVLCGDLMVRAAGESLAKQWVPKLASGEAIFSLAWLEPDNGDGPRGVQLRAERDGDGWTLRGVKRHVQFASAATRLLVLARTGDGERDIDLFLVRHPAHFLEPIQILFKPFTG